MMQTRVRLRFNLMALSFQIIDGAIFFWGGMVPGHYYSSLYHPRSQGTIAQFVVALVSSAAIAHFGQVIVCTMYREFPIQSL